MKKLSISLIFIIIVSGLHSAKAQHVGFWLEDDGPLGLLLYETGYATLFMDGEILFSGEGTELADGTTGVLIYRVNYKEPYNEIDLEIKSMPGNTVLRLYKGIFAFDEDGRMLLCTLFEDGADRPTEFEAGSTFILTYYDVED